MRVLVTGATGFVGRYVVEAALRRGHSVRAMVRPSKELAGDELFSNPALEVARFDLRRPDALADVLEGVDVVVHLAAAKEGDLYSQLAASLVGTENLMRAMVQAGVRRIVHVSSLSVYDFLRPWTFGKLTESSVVEQKPKRRENYCQSKLAQEELVRRYTEHHDLQTTIVRPGLIIGPDNAWTDQLGMKLSDRLWIGFTGFGFPLQLVCAENCADAILCCVDNTAAIGETYNIIDDDLPSRGRYRRMLKRRLSVRPWVIPMPGILVRAVARCAQWFNRLAFGGTGKFPWFATPAKLLVQAKPLRFPNQKLKQELQWQPALRLEDALDRYLPGES